MEKYNVVIGLAIQYWRKILSQEKNKKTFWVHKKKIEICRQKNPIKRRKYYDHIKKIGLSTKKTPFLPVHFPFFRH